MRMKLSNDAKLAEIQSKYKKYCKYCGHTLSFYFFEKDKKLCDWCGRYNYRNGMVEFKDKLLTKRKEVERCQLN